MPKKTISLDNVFVYFPDCNIKSNDPYLLVINDIAELFIEEMGKTHIRKHRLKKELLKATIMSLLAYLIKADYYNKLVAFKKSYKYYYFYKKNGMTHITYHLIMKAYKFLLKNGYIEEVFNPGRNAKLKYFKKKKHLYEDEEKVTRISATKKLRKLYKTKEIKYGISLKSKIIDKTYDGKTYKIYEMPWKETTESKYGHAIIISLTSKEDRQANEKVKKKQLIFLEKKILIKHSRSNIKTNYTQKQTKILYTPNNYKENKEIYKTKKFINIYNKFIEKAVIILPEDIEEIE